jgi:hypothetical protein
MRRQEMLATITWVLIGGSCLLLYLSIVWTLIRP